jgi:hypothetical protein
MKSSQPAAAPMPQAAIFLTFPSATKKPLNLSIQGLFDIAVWLTTWTRMQN